MQVLVVSPSDVTHVDRINISAAPPGFGAVAPRLVAKEAKATNKPVFEMAGCELAPLPGVVASGVETRYVVGVQDAFGAVGGTALQVLRMYTCGVRPSTLTSRTRFVASETNATYCPSELITGL
jgi:hypothetical protein